MPGPLASDDPVTRALHGKPADFVPVAPSYEFLGPLQFYRMELNWRKWSARLEQAGTDLLAVTHEDYLAHELELYSEILDTAYPRPAWLGLPRNRTFGEIAGSAVARQGEHLFWLSSDGHASWIPPHREAQAATMAAERSLPWGDLWGRGGGDPATVADAAKRPLHELSPIPAPSPGQVQAMTCSPCYHVARGLAQQYPNALPLYSTASSPYNTLAFTLGFQTMMSALAERPREMHQLLERRLPRPSARLYAERELGISIMFVEECLASADIISPRMYREFVFPYTRETLQYYEDLGFRTVLYFSGNLMPLLPYLKELPFTALACEENRKEYGIDLAEVRRALPDKVLLGNVDAAWLERATDQEVVEEVRRQIRIAGPERFLLSVGSPFTPGTSLARVRFFCEATRMV